MEQTYRRVMSGQQTGVLASLLRAFTAGLEPVYRAIVASRNSSYSAGVLRTIRVPRPVISVGNITTGGTGKTPVVRWLAEHLKERNLSVAVLMRGYKSSATRGSDERELLERELKCIVRANPDRVEGAGEVLRQDSSIDVLILDDGFQHRRIHRDFDLVLIDATNPFGYDHVLPRGLLREPLKGLARAHAFLLTRFDQALPGETDEIEKCLRRHAQHAPIFRCSHAQHQLVTDNSTHPTSWLRDKRVFAFAGIGNPEAFERQLRGATDHFVGSKWLSDHHPYDSSDLKDLIASAKRDNADVLVTTEKDWVKLAPLVGQIESPIPILRVQLEIRFCGSDGEKLLELVLSAIRNSKSAAPRAVADRSS